MSKLQLITTETFGDLSCDFYRDTNNDILLTREQIGQALEYADPSKAIRKIHLKHKDRLEKLCIRIKGEEIAQTHIGANLTKSEEQERVYYTERGIMEICRWSRQKKANEFMDWVWDIIEAYRHNGLSTQELTQAITYLTNKMSDIQKDMEIIKQQSQKKVIPIKKYSRWKVNTFDKLHILTDYVNSNSNQKLTLSDTLHITINEMQDTYDIDIMDYIRDYMFEYNLDTKPYSLDVIDHYKDLKNMYNLTITSIMDKLNLSAKPVERNIFDILAQDVI